MKLLFTTSDIFFQDNPEIDIHKGGVFCDILNLKILNNPTNISLDKEEIKHMYANRYKVIFYIDKIIDDIAFVKIKNLSFFIDNASRYSILNGNRYQCECEIYHDIWNNIVLSEEKIDTFGKEIESGVTKILFDTGVDKKQKTYSYEVQKIDGWREIELYPKSTGEYLVEINLHKKGNL